MNKIIFYLNYNLLNDKEILILEQKKNLILYLIFY